MHTTSAPPANRRTGLLLTLLLALLATALATLGAQPARATTGTNDYPSSLASPAKDSVTDPWGFYNRECTSFVAWRLNNDNGVAFSDAMAGPNGTGSDANRFGDARNWASHAASLGYSVNTTPAAGAAAVWPSSVGHVGYVDSVNADGTINTEEYNWNLDGAYHTRTSFNWSAAGIQFIHINDVSRMAFTDTSGAVYAKDGINDAWTQEISTGAQSIAVGGNGRMMVIDAAGNAYSKDTLTATWTLQFNATARVAVGGNGRMMVMNTSGAVYAKDATYDSWTQEISTGAQAIAVGGNGRMMVIDAAGNAYSKDTLTATWTLQFNGANQAAVASSGRLMVLDTTGNAYAKDSVQGSWTLEAGPNAAAIATG